MTLRAPAIALLLSLSPFALLACGSSSDGTPAGTAGTGGTSAGGSSAQAGAASGAAGGSAGSGSVSFSMPSPACVAVATATCNLLQMCDGDRVTNVFGNLSACVARYAGACALSELAPGTSQNDTRRMQCATAEQAETCADYVASLTTQLPACIAPPGSAALGGACAYNAQCATGYCGLSTTSTCGTCEPVPTAGADCSNTKDCLPASGLRCATDQIMMTETCEAPLVDGAPCSSSSQCAEQSFCYGYNSTTMALGTCTAYLTTLNAPCNPKKGQDCDPTYASLTCDPTALTCVPVQFAQPGAPCGDLTEGVYTGCSGGSECINNGSGDVCEPAVAEGMACDTVNGPQCLTPAICSVASVGGTSGTCALRDATLCH